MPHLSIDCVIFGYQARELKVLISKFNFKGNFYGLPSGFILHTEGVDEAAYRILKERTGIENIYLEQFKIFGEANRNNKVVFDYLWQDEAERKKFIDISGDELQWFKSRFISFGYYALVDITKVTPQKTDIDESMTWYSIHDLPNLIMDHKQIIEKALDSMRLSLDKNIIILNLLPEVFTMKEVQDLYETIFEQTYARNNFQKKILELNVLERLEKKYTGAQNKAPYLYRFKR